MKNRIRIVGAMALLLGVSARANAQMAVIDVQSLVQLQQQAQYWQQQISAMSNQIETLRQQLSSLTGARGMGALLTLSNAQRNYLPSSANAILAATTAGQPSVPALHSAYEAVLTSQSALSPGVTALLSPADMSAINARRSAIATRSSVMQAALASASTRFSQIQALIDQVDRTPDAKASIDLQGRIAAEQAMTTNEAAKLAATAAWTDANIAAAQTRAAEAAVSAHGVFGSRFHPGTP